MTVNFSCPFIAVTTPITWRGPPNLTIYSINKKVNRQIDKLNRIDVNGNSTMQQYNLSVFNFTTIDTGVYRCDTLMKKHFMKHEIEVNIAGNWKHYYLWSKFMYQGSYVNYERYIVKKKLSSLLTNICFRKYFLTSKQQNKKTKRIALSLKTFCYRMEIND